MATLLQKKAIESLVEAGRTKKRIIKRQVLLNAGYSQDVADQPDKVLKAKGFLQLADELGLTENFLTKALVADIKGKPKKRTKELELGFKVRGMLKDNNGGGNTYNFAFLSEEQQQRIARRLQTGNSESEARTD